MKTFDCPICKIQVECATEAGKMALEHALSNIGNREKTGHNDGAFVETRQRWASIPLATLKKLTLASFYKLVNGTQKIASYYINAPWCCMAATLSAWMGCERAGVPCNIVQRASTVLLAAEFKKKGKLSEHCINGSIAMLKSAKGVYEHTFLAIHQVGDVIHGIDGNYGNMERTTNVHLTSRCTFGPVEG